MKLIILAAGSGSRLKEIDSNPKPLIRIKNKPMIWWALKSFHELLTQGLLTKNDIYIAIQKSQIENFLGCQEIKDFFGEINPFIVIEKLTSGPGETGLLAVNQLIQDGLISAKDKIVFSDTDHFVWSPNIFRDIKMDSEIYLWQTKKDASLDWCFATTENGKIHLLEKPSKIENFDVSLGLIGVYGFKSVEIFVTAANKLICNEIQSTYPPGGGEIFMSSVINMALKETNSVSLSIVKFFVPLGNPDQIEKASKLPDPDFFIFDSPTYFVDIDGVIFKHKYKNDSNSPEKIEIELSANVKTLNERYMDGLIIIVSARPENQFNYIESALKRSGVNFDRLILGCTGGVRYLINDLKPGKEYTETAIAINIERDGVLNIEEPDISYSNLKGGSGAKTLVIQQGNKFIVKKFATKDNDIQILKNQCSWYLHVQKLLGKDAPTLNVLRSIENLNQYVLWTAYEQDLVGLYDWCTSINVSYEKIRDVKSNSVQFKSIFGEEVDLKLAIPLIEKSFSQLYSSSTFDHHYKSTDVLIRIINDKIFPSLDKTISRFAENKEIKKILYDLRECINLFRSPKYLARYGFQGAVACIHGDPTFSNLQVSTDRSRVIFTDPIGAAIEADYDFSKFRPESFPVFDLARLELSYKYNYEFNQKILETKELCDEEIEAIANFTVDRPSISEFLSKSVFLPFDTRNLDLVVATSMLRILKYKTDHNEIKLLALQASKILKSLL